MAKESLANDLKVCCDSYLASWVHKRHKADCYQLVYDRELVIVSYVTLQGILVSFS